MIGGKANDELFKRTKEFASEWGDPLGYHDVPAAEDFISSLQAENKVLKNRIFNILEDLETIDRMPFQTVDEAADFANEAIELHKTQLGEYFFEEN